ncbi:conserved exported hypothetical protein [Mesorhizobium prunaredense]|uniref:Lipoprotein n=1 Tax=Mesorhizobium prunaredense TaxID=1631249 RepID=A0A1R3V7D3_9HYPH|nr:hypothetical protein [Mesorhizobium prunaredense]SIT55741.1 conserved exported hypothetical protein [Mesorhizobium prunaredense]
MTFRIALCSVLPVLLLVGCANGRQQPQEYSPGYSYVSTDIGGSQKGVGGSVLAPNACLNEPADDNRSAAATGLTIVSGVGSHLPPGCANAYNLQRMAESQRDLVEGRRMGAAAAAPTANAARRYLNGEEAPMGGANSGPPTPQTTLPVE